MFNQKQPNFRMGSPSAGKLGTKYEFNNPKDILFKKSIEEKEKQNERNLLLKELGDNLTPAQTLYSSNEDLKKIKEEKTNQSFASKPKEELSIKERLYGKSKVDGVETEGAIQVCKPEDNKTSTSISELYKKNPAMKPKEEKIDNRILSDDALKKVRKFIKNKEGFDENAYQDTGGVWTIGYGHTKNVKQGDKVTQEQANELFRQDLSEHIDSLKHVKVKLSENEKAALSSLIYNIGGTRFYKSDLLKKLNSGDKKGAANEFDKWIYDNGKIQKGLVNRRKAEKELFLLQD